MCVSPGSQPMVIGVEWSERENEDLGEGLSEFFATQIHEDV